MITAMIKPDPNSDFKLSGTPPHSRSNTNPPLKLSKPKKFNPNIQSKLLSPEFTDTMQRSSSQNILLIITFSTLTSLYHS